MAMKKWRRCNHNWYNREVQWQHWTSLIIQTINKSSLKQRHFPQHKHRQNPEDAHGEHQHDRD